MIITKMMTKKLLKDSNNNNDTYFTEYTALVSVTPHTENLHANKA